MPHRSLSPRRPAPHRERGVVLIIGLIMLMIITIISVAAIRTTTTDEKIAGNARDRDRAFQAAEAAVRSCLARVNVKPVPVTVLTVPPSAVGTAPVWENASHWAEGATTSYAVDSIDSSLAVTPRCLIERFSIDPPSYRVTGRATGGSADTVVMLQATISEEE